MNQLDLNLISRAHTSMIILKKCSLSLIFYMEQSREGSLKMFPHQWLFALCSNVLIICITILREYFLRYGIFNIINSLTMIKCGGIFGNQFSLFWHMTLGLSRAKIHRPSKTIQSFKKIVCSHMPIISYAKM